jgi:hypothetical protein
MVVMLTSSAIFASHSLSQKISSHTGLYSRDKHFFVYNVIGVYAQSWSSPAQSNQVIHECCEVITSKIGILWTYTFVDIDK